MPTASMMWGLRVDEGTFLSHRPLTLRQVLTRLLHFGQSGCSACPWDPRYAGITPHAPHPSKRSDPVLTLTSNSTASTLPSESSPWISQFLILYFYFDYLKQFK